VGKILALILLYEIHDIDRFPRVQQFVSYCRLVKCSKESAGKIKGTAGRKIGNAHLKWAFSEAAVIMTGQSAAAKRFVDRKTRRYGKGKALSILAARLARATYFILKRQQPFDERRLFAT
jgi:transposase